MKKFFFYVKLALTENFVILQREALLDFWSIQGVTERNQQQKLGILTWENKREKKMWMVKVTKFCQVTWMQKAWQKRES